MSNLSLEQTKHKKQYKNTKTLKHKKQYKNTKNNTKTQKIENIYSFMKEYILPRIQTIKTKSISE
jgi:hypothetical protein